MRTFTVNRYSHSVLLSLWLLGGSAHAEQAIFAGGCFWCLDYDFETVAGVQSVGSGYTGGHLPNPDYKRVSSGGTGHYEAIEVSYDPTIVSYSELLAIYWVNIDPLDGEGQFCDRGDSYRSALFPLNDEQREAAIHSKAAAQKRLGATVVTRIIDAKTFYPAEEYHQDYHQKNPLRYKYYRWGCRRDDRLQTLWGSDAIEQ